MTFGVMDHSDHTNNIRTSGIFKISTTLQLLGSLSAQSGVDPAICVDNSREIDYPSKRKIYSIPRRILRKSKCNS